MMPLNPYIKILRPLNASLSIISVLISAHLLDLYFVSAELILACLVVFLFTGGANIVNDLFDYRIDSVNRPERPLPSGKIKPKAARIYAFILFCLGSAAAIQLPVIAAVIALILVLPMIVLYTPLLKRIPLAGNLIIAGILGSVFIFAEAALTAEIGQLWIPAGLAFGLTLIRELVKDMQDIPGDSKNSILTFPVRFGFRNSLMLATGFTILLCVLSPLPYVMNLYGIFYLLALIFGVEVPLIYSIFYLWENPTSTASGKISGVLKLTTIAGIFVIFISKF
ncbi:MAG: UbiA family prenyltransferase [FCB group bacterium]|nr:UbiA family prenyltransferase [FCB group bacterium]